MTSHTHIEEVAFRLFEESGFEETTVEAIAEAAGIGRRTLFRYYPSKNDILWGRFDESLDRLARTLRSAPPETSLAEAIRSGIKEFNALEPEAVAQHRARMRLLMETPALQAHAVLRHAAWRRVVAEFAADRTGASPDDLLPRAAGRWALAIAMTAYEQWLEDEAALLPDLLDAAYASLVDLPGL